MFKRVTVAVAAALVLGVVAAPTAASASQSWRPEAKAPAGGIYIESSVDPKESSAIQSSYEKTLGEKKSNLYTYVAKVPETWQTETAAREVAEAWKLDREKDSLLFYDAQGGKTFVWPATTANEKLASSLPANLNTSAFAQLLPKLYQPTLQQEKIDSSQSSFQGFVYGWIAPLFVMVLLLTLLFTISKRMFY